MGHQQPTILVAKEMNTFILKASLEWYLTLSVIMWCEGITTHWTFHRLSHLPTVLTACELDLKAMVEHFCF